MLCWFEFRNVKTSEITDYWSALQLLWPPENVNHSYWHFMRMCNQIPLEVPLNNSASLPWKLSSISNPGHCSFPHYSPQLGSRWTFVVRDLLMHQLQGTHFMFPVPSHFLPLKTLPLQGSISVFLIITLLLRQWLWERFQCDWPLIFQNMIFYCLAWVFYKITSSLCCTIPWPKLRGVKD